MVQVTWLLLIAASVAASSREIEFKQCKSDKGVTCKVRSVTISGCLEPSSWVEPDGTITEYQQDSIKSPCRIDSGSTLNFTIDYEPGFSEESLRSQFSLPDLPECWGSYDSRCPLTQPPAQACSFTKCPLTAGRPNRFETSLQVNDRIARRPVNDRRVYQMRWKLWNNKHKKHNCCFNIPIQY